MDKASCGVEEDTGNLVPVCSAQGGQYTPEAQAISLPALPAVYTAATQGQQSNPLASALRFPR